MISLEEEIQKCVNQGFAEEQAIAKVGQDVILYAISRSHLNENITVKGGVVMRELSHNNRRATQDIDIDFIRYSIDEDSIKSFIKTLNNIDGVSVSLVGQMEDLKQQDYHGKRVFLKLSDSFNFEVTSKVDIGVHKHIDISQEEFCFDIALQNDCISLLINSKEQMFSEKLRSLLKFGIHSTRYKDVFDLYWLSQNINREKLLNCMNEIIFSDEGMKENSMADIVKRIEKVYGDKSFRRLVARSKKNWLDIDDDVACDGLINFLQALQVEKEMDTLWESGEWDDKKNEAILSEHLRMHRHKHESATKPVKYWLRDET